MTSSGGIILRPIELSLLAGDEREAVSPWLTLLREWYMLSARKLTAKPKFNARFVLDGKFVSFTSARSGVEYRCVC